MPEPSPTDGSDLRSREELIAIVDALLNGTIDEEDQFEVLDQIAQQFKHPVPFDLIFFSADVPGLAKEEPTAEEIVDFGLNYQPRRLPRNELLRVLQKFLYPQRTIDTERDRYYLLSENLPGYDMKI